MHRRLCLLFAVLASVSGSENALALSNYSGDHFYFGVLGSTHRNPIFTKEFAEGPGMPTFGGKDELPLPGEQTALGARIGYEKINYQRAGLGLSLTYWRVEFDDIAFRYDREGSRNSIAEYRAPTHDFVFLDVSGIFIPWESGWQALGVYGLLSLVTDHQKYDIDKFSVTTDQSQRSDLVSTRETALDGRFAFGFGTRIHLARRLSLWLEKRWIVGETFSRAVSSEDGSGTTE